MGETIYLIDGSAYIYRAYHALVPLSNSKGMPTHAVLGFINMIRKLYREKKPSHLAIAFDSRGPVFRHELYDQYKANRPPMPDDLQVQIPYIKRYVAACGIKVFEEQGLEADDFLASATLHLAAQGNEIVLVSGDKDLMQLIGDGVMMWDPMKDKEIRDEEVRAKYGLGPESLLDLFSLIGDSSDNVPGVAGIGPKTALKLLEQFGSLDELYLHVEELKPSKMKENLLSYRELAFLSRTLISLKTDIPIQGDLAQYEVVEGNTEELQSLFEELEFSTLLKELDTAKPVSGAVFRRLDESSIAEFAKALQGVKTVALDTETTSLQARKAKLVGVSLCASEQEAWYLPLGHLDEKGALVDNQLSLVQVRQLLQPILEDPQIIKVGHNLKYDLMVLGQHGFQVVNPIADTLLAAYLTESGGRSLKLDDLCLERGIRLTSFAEVVAGDKREDCFAYVDLDKATHYSCEDAYATLLLWRELEPLLAEKEVAELFWKVEMEVLRLLVEMELAGIKVDLDVLQALSSEFTAGLAAMEVEIHKLAGEEFNINSPKQLGVILFDKLGLPHGRKTKTGYSTDVKVLERLAPKHPLPALILRYRSLAKLLSTYVEKLSQYRDEATSRVHSTFNQAVTATGRLSSSDPNLQNLPIRTEEGSRVREAFVAGPGMVFLSADYSQIDLRVLAHYCGDKALVQAFQAGEDIHARTAAEIFNVSPLLITSEMRRVAKSINFGIVYGMSSFGLSSQLEISRRDAQRFIDRYFGVYEGVKSFMNEVVDEAREKGYVTTLLKRRRSLPEILSSNKMQREFAERTAINTPIQGSAADIIKLAMIACHRAITEQGLAARMLLQIHDELVFEVPEEEVEKASEILKAAMEGVLELAVPLVVNVSVGENLGK